MKPAAALLIFASASAVRADWPQFLGPERDGKSTEKTPLISDFPDTGPKILWKRELGAGFAGPVVAEGKVFIFHRIGKEVRLEALDADDGKPRWTCAFPTDYRDSFGFDDGPRSCPTVSGGKVFLYGADGRFYAVSSADGKLLWKRDFAAEMESPQGFFGRTGAPLAVGRCVLAQPGGSANGKPAAVLALDVETGKTLWQAGNQEAGYASPVLWKTTDGTCAVFFLREGLLGVSPDTGKVWFEIPHRSAMEASVNAATPVVLGPERIFTSACYGVGATAWAWNGGKLVPAWKTEQSLDCHYSTPVFSGGSLFGFHGRQESGMELRCVDAASGKVRWTSGRIAAGDVLVADEKLIIVTEDGELILGALSAEKFTPLARGQILGSGHRSPPAISGGILHARDRKQLVAVDLRR